jgi:hypothetical protein
VSRDEFSVGGTSLQLRVLGVAIGTHVFDFGFQPPEVWLRDIVVAGKLIEAENNRFHYQLCAQRQPALAGGNFGDPW